MLNRRLLCLVGVLTLLPEIALGDEFVNRCVDLSAVRTAMTAHNAKLIELTPDQWQFLRGIYAMSPETPPGLPYGDKALLAKIDGDADGLVFFVDGDKACTPMHAPSALLSMMDEVAMGNINHQGAGL
jgi:hypothetical protein